MRILYYPAPNVFSKTCFTLKKISTHAETAEVCKDTTCCLTVLNPGKHVRHRRSPKDSAVDEFIEHPWTGGGVPQQRLLTEI